MSANALSSWATFTASASASSEPLGGSGALAVEQVDLELEAVELEAGVEVVDEPVERAPRLFGRRGDLAARELGDGVEEALGVGENARADRDSVGGHALGGGAAVVTREVDARRRVGIAWHLRRAVGT